MKQKTLSIGRNVLLSAMAISAFAEAAQAQQFTNTSTGDLVLGFRKTGSAAGNYDVVVDIGRATNLLNLAAGATTNITAYSASTQLVSPSNSFPNLTNLQWSAFGDAHNSGVPGYPTDTMWLTNPRSTFGVQTDPPDRQSQGTQAPIVSKIESILNGAEAMSGLIGASNTFNTVTFLSEPLSNSSIDQGDDLGVYIAGVADSTQGTFQDNWYDDNSSPINVENTTGAPFSSPQQSDLYEIRPTGHLDPHTLLNGGSAYYMGYFQLNTNGTMTFTRASGPLPPAPQLTISRTGNNSIISFATTNGAVYTLYATNTSGITNPIATWPVLGSTITGTGNTTNFVDTTTNSSRVYRVSAH